MRAHPSVQYIHRYETAETLFGKEMSANELLGCIRTFSWSKSLVRLANLAAIVANEPGGVLSERVRRLTVDPLVQLRGDASCGQLLQRGRQAVASRRNEILLAHEEAISFLQHLVINDGAAEGDAPGDSELALWLAGANGHLAKWAQEEADGLSATEKIAAELMRILRYNNKPDLARCLVRSFHIFNSKPSTGGMSEEEWQTLRATAFCEGFESFFETGLGLVTMLATLWGLEGGTYPQPIINIPTFLSNSKVSQQELLVALTGLTATRDELRRAIQKRLRRDGLPHSPTALYYSPLVEVAPLTYVGASPWALVAQLRTGIWARYLAAAKTIDPKKGADKWLSAFGYMVEDWCRRMADEAAASNQLNARILKPQYPGAKDEVEDVVVVEDDTAILFSVKGRLVEAKVSREAVSPHTIMTWFEKFFFEDKGSEYRGGALRQVSARIDKIRNGDFESLGIAKTIRVVPVIVTYDALGETDFLYHWLKDECEVRSLLQQPGVTEPVLARLEEFEQLLSRVARGLPIAQLLMSHGNRRLDQVLYEAEPSNGPQRLPLLDEECKKLSDRIHARFFGAPSREAS